MKRLRRCRGRSNHRPPIIRSPVELRGHTVPKLDCCGYWNASGHYTVQAGKTRKWTSLGDISQGSGRCRERVNKVDNSETFPLPSKSGFKLARSSHFSSESRFFIASASSRSSINRRSSKIVVKFSAECGQIFIFASHRNRLLCLEAGCNTD